jgi:hypothetical protein
MSRANAGQALLASLGLHARPDYSNHDRYHLRHTGDLDALRDVALEEGPGSVAYARWMAALQNGDDENLPDLELFNGAIPMSIEAQREEMRRAEAQAQQHWIPDRIDPRLHSLGWGGRSFASMTPDEAREIANLQLAEALPHERGDWFQVLEAIDNSHTSSMGISWEGDSTDLSYTLPSEVPGHADAYTQWREASQNIQGLQALNINHASADQQIFSGMSPDGMSYNSADDWALNQFAGALDATHGDDANTFTDAMAA